jgi:hypothetical protein
MVSSAINGEVNEIEALNNGFDLSLLNKIKGLRIGSKQRSNCSSNSKLRKSPSWLKRDFLRKRIEAVYTVLIFFWNVLLPKLFV